MPRLSATQTFPVSTSVWGQGRTPVCRPPPDLPRFTGPLPPACLPPGTRLHPSGTHSDTTGEAGPARHTSPC